VWIQGDALVEKAPLDRILNLSKAAVGFQLDLSLQQIGWQ
jgi:hypothetical protein